MTCRYRVVAAVAVTLGLCVAAAVAVVVLIDRALTAPYR